ncbi:hypothetical protein ACOBQX_04740 [Actinokineospora sp. G85]|uniref:hypothetical protein n=1 Tax=Actinokineospora sp. G85 TaxID=3406626 RepID=UPI003C771B3D
MGLRWAAAGVQAQTTSSPSTAMLPWLPFLGLANRLWHRVPALSVRSRSGTAVTAYEVVPAVRPQVHGRRARGGTGARGHLGD